MAKCPICKQELSGFNWTKTKNNKNWLADKDGNWHDCPNNNGKKKYVMSKASDFVFCNMCGNFHEDLDEHVKKHHPRGEILDNIDYMVISDVEKEKTRLELNQPRRTIKW